MGLGGRIQRGYEGSITFTQTLVSSWNELLKSEVDVEWMPTFKGSLDKHLNHLGKDTNPISQGQVLGDGISMNVGG